jgi:spoIIIJ-associated protein
VEKAERAPRPEKAAAAPRPRQPRPPKPAADADGESNNNPKSSEEQVVDARQVGEEASRFMGGLVEAFGFEGEVELVEDGDDLEVRVHGRELGLLVGPRGTTLQAVQDLARVASQRRLGDHDTRLRVDIGGYRERRREALGKFATQMSDEVKASGVARVLEPMTSADRKIIHDTLSEVEGIATRSEGDDPYRRVIIAPAND